MTAESQAGIGVGHAGSTCGRQSRQPAMHCAFDALALRGLPSRRFAQLRENHCMWGRLSLRWQVALAVLVPSIVISVLSSMYFPPKQMQIGLHRLKERAHAVGGLATEQASIILEAPESEQSERL